MTVTVDFHGAELEPFQLHLLETLNVRAVNFEPVGACRAAARRAVRVALENPRRDDELTARARRWLKVGINPEGGE